MAMARMATLASLATLMASWAPSAEARQVSGSSDSTSKVSLFYNKEAVNPAAKDSTGTASVSAELKWEVENLTWRDEDTAEDFMEITTTLTAPILSSDTITFHLEFTSSK